MAADRPAAFPGPDRGPPPPPTGLQLTVSAVARRVGVAPATLRTWARRYGVGPSDHCSGSHRRYAPRDVLRLELMHHFLVHGAAPAEAARLALAAPADTTLPTPDPATPPPGGEHSVAGLVLVDDAANTRGTTHGSRLRLRGAGPHVRGLARAAVALDAAGAVDLMSRSVAEHGVVHTWDDVVRPVLRAVAERWERTGAGIEVEHLLTEAVTTVMARTTAAAPPPVSARPVLLGSMPGELHALPLRVLAATLAERRVGVSLLGADLPADALAAAIGRTGPAAALLWSQSEASADTELVDRLPRTRPRTRCYLGGPGWDLLRLPATVVVLDSLQEACTVLTAAAGL